MSNAEPKLDKKHFDVTLNLLSRYVIRQATINIAQWTQRGMLFERPSNTPFHLSMPAIIMAQTVYLHQITNVL